MKFREVLKSNRRLFALIPALCITIVLIDHYVLDKATDVLLDLCQIELDIDARHHPLPREVEVYHQNEARSVEANRLLESGDGPKTFQTLILVPGPYFNVACSRGEEGQHWQTSSYSWNFYASFAWHTLPWLLLGWILRFLPPEFQTRQGFLEATPRRKFYVVTTTIAAVLLFVIYTWSD